MKPTILAKHLLIALLLAACLASLWSVQFLTPGRAWFAMLHGGAFTVNHFPRGGFDVSSPGVYLGLGDFSGDSMRWSPRVTIHDSLWVSPTPTTPGPVTVTPRKIPCSTVVVPMWMPLLAVSLWIGGSWWRRRRVRLKGHCRECGYDRRTLPPPCPECGSRGPTFRVAA